MPRPKLFFGARKDPNDPRDYQFSKLFAKVELPTEADLSNFDSPIRSQENLGSCTGFAITGAVENLYKRLYNKSIVLSPLFTYYLERELENAVQTDQGAFLRDGCKVASTRGSSLEKYWPYDVTKFAKKPSIPSYISAFFRKIKGYYRVGTSDVSEVKTALLKGIPVLCSIPIYSSFSSNSTGKIVYPDVSKESFLGGHAIVIVGYKDEDKPTTGWLKCKNSWGPEWGRRGYFYISYKYFVDLAWDAWAFVPKEK